MNNMINNCYCNSKFHKNDHYVSIKVVVKDIFRDIRSDFRFLFYFSMKFLKANRIAQDRTSHLGHTAFCGVTSGAIPFAYVP